MSEQPGNTQEWGTAKVVETNEEAVLIVGFLQNSGIPAEVESLHASELPVDVGALGEVRVRVPKDRLEEALAALDLQEKAASLPDEPDEDDAGDPMAGTDGAENTAEPGDVRQAMSTLASGQLVGRYRIVRFLGAGAMGEVYLAEDPHIERQLAIKTVRLAGGRPQDIEDRKRRLLREARAAGRLLHPNVVTLFDTGEAEGLLYLAFEFVEGCDLASRLDAAPPLALREVLRIVRSVAEALDYAHRQGIVHRDIKPSNILIDLQGHVKVADFGIAKVAGQNTELTVAGSVMGSPQYLSPEQIRGDELDGRSDIFSLGVVLYEMLSGRRPFDGETITTLVYQILHKEPSIAELRSVPLQIEQLLHQMMAKERDERISTAAGVAQELAAIERELPDAVLAAPAAPPADVLDATRVMPSRSLPGGGLAGSGGLPAAAASGGVAAAAAQQAAGAGAPPAPAGTPLRAFPGAAAAGPAGVSGSSPAAATATAPAAGSPLPAPAIPGAPPPGGAAVAARRGTGAKVLLLVAALLLLFFSAVAVGGYWFWQRYLRPGGADATVTAATPTAGSTAADAGSASGAASTGGAVGAGGTANGTPSAAAGVGDAIAPGPVGSAGGSRGPAAPSGAGGPASVGGGTGAGGVSPGSRAGGAPPRLAGSPTVAGSGANGTGTSGPAGATAAAGTSSGGTAASPPPPPPPASRSGAGAAAPRAADGTPGTRASRSAAASPPPYVPPSEQAAPPPSRQPAADADRTATTATGGDTRGGAPAPPTPAVDKVLHSGLELAFRVNPPDAFVLLDGAVIGKAEEWSGQKGERSFMLPEAGSHLVKIKKAGMKDYRISVEATATRGTTPVVVNLQPLPAAQIEMPDLQTIQVRDSIALHVQPDVNAVILVDGATVGPAKRYAGRFGHPDEWLSLPPGTHRVTVVSPGYSRRDLAVEVNPGADKARQKIDVNLVRENGG